MGAFFTPVINYLIKWKCKYILTYLGSFFECLILWMNPVWMFNFERTTLLVAVIIAKF